MSKIPVSVLALVAAAACGGSAVPTSEFRDNAPSYSQVALTQTSADEATPTSSAPATSSSTALTTTDCTPHLMDRSHDLMAHVNRHFWKHLRHVRDLIADHPALADGNEHVWENVANGVDRKLTMTRIVNADASVTYTFELDLKSSSVTDFVKVAWGSITRTPSTTTDAGVSTAAESQGQLTFDYSALHQAVPAEAAVGQVEDAFHTVNDPVKGVKRVATVTLTNFTFDDDAANHPARNGVFVWEREPGVGGSFQFQDQVPLCVTSSTGTTGGQLADVKAVARWYHPAAGGVSGRTDATASGGAISAGDVWMGVTCAQSATDTTPAEAYWLLKLEDSSGATVSGKTAISGTSPCDAALGATVPTLTDNQNDFDFSSLDFTTPYPFPNMW